MTTALLTPVSPIANQAPRRAAPAPCERASSGNVAGRWDGDRPAVLAIRWAAHRGRLTARWIEAPAHPVSVG